MVGVINPNSTQSLERQIQSAKSADFEVAPGGKIPSESSASWKAPEATDSALPGHSIGPVGHSISPGGIVGIVIGGLCVVALCAALFFIAIRRKPAVTAPPGTEPVVEIGSSSVPHSPAYQPASPYQPAPPYHSWSNAAVARRAEVSPVSPQNQPIPLGPAELDPDQMVNTHAACKD
ncbi:hypothetical protein DM02DRAFT_664765 [Periconia macrospinosa]|uniref:Uncharacterized protein n=1 Tax=Periconia macrospinosa TaxID=97972 RepID=A0A2V1D0D7_9PLEO|nr:hypothetical protein DM02DRAFT_664765 [Periconia macrospinosa]